MAIYKCKMCGGDLHPEENAKLITCEYCGTTQTVCHVDDSRLANLFNRANEQRLLNEFDKAEALYENILVENPYESEAYWGKILCKYGIEYVDDPKTGKKIPTCHRAIYESIYDDQDYQRALRNADPVSEVQYKDEAKEIDRLQKNILEIAAKEDPYDVFICYKETDDAGERTQDSVYAQDIYNELTQKGYKVFFSRITLESKLGMEYEPYIFSALQTAKVMIVIGSKYDYFDSIWVKNEWKRYLNLIQNGKGNKTLIPCYFNMSPYDMPKDFSMLQGQDLSKIGAIQDIVRGVEKLLDTTHVGGNSLDKNAIDTLMQEREERKKKSKRIKKIVLITIPVLVLVTIGIFLVVSYSSKTNSSDVSEKEKKDNYKAKILNDVSEGIPDNKEYDVLIIKLTKDNVNDLLKIGEYKYQSGDAFEKTEKIKYILKNMLHDSGWINLSGGWESELRNKLFVEESNEKINDSEYDNYCSFGIKYDNGESYSWTDTLSGKRLLDEKVSIVDATGYLVYLSTENINEFKQDYNSCYLFLKNGNKVYSSGIKAIIEP